MKAVLLRRYGGIDVLEMAEVSDPHAGPGEVRIRVKAAGVNPVDTKIRSGAYQQRLPHQLPVIPGFDVAGVIDEIGPGVSLHAVGDRVYSFCRKPVVQFGSYAEFITLPETQVAPMPASLDFEHAAAVPVAALTAWQALYDIARIKAGQRVLVHAAAGGVGSFAAQMAKNSGAFVLGTAGRKNHDYIRSLGVDMAIDYTGIDFRDAVLNAFPNGIDVVLDAVGGELQARSADVLVPGGILVSILLFQDESALKQRGIDPRYLLAAPNRAQLEEIAGLIDEGKIRVPLSQILPLEQAAEAHRLIETRHVTGKIVLRIGV